MDLDIVLRDAERSWCDSNLYDEIQIPYFIMLFCKKKSFITKPITVFEHTWNKCSLLNWVVLKVLLTVPFVTILAELSFSEWN